jgi:hypothetical protein
VSATVSVYLKIGSLCPSTGARSYEKLLSPIPMRLQSLIYRAGRRAGHRGTHAIFKKSAHTTPFSEDRIKIPQTPFHCPSLLRRLGMKRSNAVAWIVARQQSDCRPGIRRQIGVFPAARVPRSGGGQRRHRSVARNPQVDRTVSQVVR